MSAAKTAAPFAGLFFPLLFPNPSKPQPYAMLHLLRLLLLCCSVLLTSCITQEVEDDTRRGNFEALWHTLDAHYCFFDYKRQEYGLDWNEVYDRYHPRIDAAMTDRQLFEVRRPRQPLCRTRCGTLRTVVRRLPDEPKRFARKEISGHLAGI